MKNKEQLKSSQPTLNMLTSPQFFRLSRQEDKAQFEELWQQHPHLQVYDQIEQQLEELIIAQHPSEQFNKEKLKEAMLHHLGEASIDTYGVWIFYPWSHRMVHLLDEEEFVFLRTNRNKYKITEREQRHLATQKVGIIGLSVGQSAAINLAMERGCGELRIADFDTLDLTNLNRIRAGAHQLGLPKTTLVAREIAEIDPYLKVTCYEEGINTENITNFISKNGKLDLLIDECDSLDIKLLCREKAREAKIPVLMDTSDRGMIDIERFDIEPDRDILHGLIADLNTDLSKAMQDPQQRIQLSLRIGGGEAISDRLKKSLPEIGKSISTWPQLASAVAMGGAAVTEISRKILCKHPVPSGRFYIDLQEIIKIRDTADSHLENN